MSETREQRDEQPNQRNDNILDYPNGSPRRWRSIRPLWPLVVGTLTTTVVTGGGVLTLISATARPMLGATRSMQLEWQTRQQEVDQTIAAEHPTAPTCFPADNETPSQS